MRRGRGAVSSNRPPALTYLEPANRARRGENGESGLARRNTEDRLVKFKSAINHTLYTQFDHGKVDDQKAEKAYGSLLRQLGEPRVAVATTNYDRSAESALISLGYTIVNGFIGRPPRRQIFEPSSLAKQRGKGTTLLHLHGAVGWYERDGQVILDPPDERFDPHRGSPVVLYPDPKKKPSENALVSELWQELWIAAEEAKSVLVIGHSLHDDPLVEVLSAVSKGKPVAVSFHAKQERKRVEERLPSALPFRLDFGPDAELAANVRKHLRSRQ